MKNLRNEPYFKRPLGISDRWGVDVDAFFERYPPYNPLLQHLSVPFQTVNS